MTDETMEELYREIGIDSFRLYARELVCHSLITMEDIAQKMNAGHPEVERQLAKGKLYARRFDPAVVKKICEDRPDIIPEIEPVLNLIKQDNPVAFPAWQIRADGSIRPEVLKARKAYALFAEEAKQRGFEYSTAADDEDIDSFFKSTGGLGTEALSTFLVNHPSRSLTIDTMKSVWWRRKNPDGLFF